MLKYSFFLAILITLGTISSASTYYVANEGNNVNSGSIGSPFRTISYGISKVKAGDILYVRNGIYNERIYISGINGIGSNPIRILAFPGEFPTVDGSNISTGEGGALVQITSSYIHFIGFKVRNSVQVGIALTSSSNHCKIGGCVVNNCWKGGILSLGDYGVVEFCTIYDCCLSNSDGIKSPGETWGAGLSIRGKTGTSVTVQNIARNNTVHDVWGEGLSVVFCDHTIVEDNIIYNNFSALLYSRNSHNGLFRRNLVYMTKNMGPGRPGGLSHYNEGTDTYINANNTFINNIVYGCNRNFHSSGILTNLLVANNTFVNSNYFACVQINGYQEDSNSVFSNNIVFQEDKSLYNVYRNVHSGDGMALTCSNNLFDSPANNRFYTGIKDIEGDPCFSNDGSLSPGELTVGYFKPLSNSAAIDKGIMIENVNDDIAGISRKFPFDIGAHEFNDLDTSVKVTDIIIETEGGNASISAYRGTLQLMAVIKPSDAANKSVTWSVVNGTGLATVDSNGLVTAVSNGSVTIKATANDGSAVSGTIVLTISNQGNSPGLVYVNSVVEDPVSSLLEIFFNLTLLKVLPAISAFSVSINSTVRNITEVSISGEKVLLKLASPVKYGDNVYVTYVKPVTNPLKTFSGEEAASFSMQVVTNNVRNNAGLPVKIYPNPATGYINLRIDESAVDPVTLLLSDMSGSVILNLKLEPGRKELTIPINLKTGTYILSLGNDNSVFYTQKLIVIN